MKVFNQIKWLFVLQATLLLSAAYTIIKTPSGYTYPDDDPNTYPYFCNGELPWAMFCISDVEVTKNVYIYFLFEHLILVMFAFYMWAEAVRNRVALFIFFWIHVIDTIDYLVAYGQTWFYVAYYPINWNVLKAAVFAIAIINEVLLIKEREAMLR